MVIFNTILSVTYFKNTKQYILHQLHLLVPSSEKGYVEFLVWLGLFLLLQLFVFLVFVPERLKYPSLIGCAIIFLIFGVFWAYNVSGPMDGLSSARPFVLENAFPLISSSITCYEGFYGYFAARSSMNRKSDFGRALRIAYVLIFALSMANCMSFYVVD